MAHVTVGEHKSFSLVSCAECMYTVAFCTQHAWLRVCALLQPRGIAGEQ
jgi:hypothetical protein